MPDLFSAPDQLLFRHMAFCFQTMKPVAEIVAQAGRTGAVG